MTDASPDHGHHDLSEIEEVLADDDPRTPAWLTALGAVLFCAAFGWILVSQGSSADAPGSAAAKAAASDSDDANARNAAKPEADTNAGKGDALERAPGGG